MELIPLLTLTHLAALLSPPAFAGRLPRFTPTAAFTVTRLSPRFRYYSAVRRLAEHRFPLRFNAYRVTYPDATWGPGEPSWGHALVFRTVQHSG